MIVSFKSTLPMKISRIIGSFCFIIVAFFVFEVFYLNTSSIQDKKGVTYYLHPGISKTALISDLAKQGIITHPFLFSLYTHFQKSEQLKTGEYLFHHGATPATIWKQVVTGTGFAFHPFTIVPGWTFTQLKEALSQTEGLHHATSKVDDKAIMVQLGYANLAPEGEFFPETYYYTRGISDMVILKRAIDLMQLHLQEAWAQRDKDLPYTNSYQALIAASIIEKEAYLSHEQPLIAGVLVNRLKKDMLLQFDPTVIYGLGTRYDGKIHKTDLLDSNPYNTYVHKGLPPTPIAMPGMSAINAALHPAKHDYLYFVANGDGSHHFSKTLAEHNEAINASNKNQTVYSPAPAVPYPLHSEPVTK